MQYIKMSVQELRAAYRKLLNEQVAAGFPAVRFTQEGRDAFDDGITDSLWMELGWDQLAVRELVAQTRTMQVAYHATRERAALTGELELFPMRPQTY